MLTLTSKGLIPGLWMAWALYWAFSAPGVKAVLRREDLASRLSHFAPLFLAGWLLGNRKRSLGLLSLRWVPITPVTTWVGIGLVALGLGFAIWARAHLGRNWSAFVTVKQGHELVRSGPYEWVRHPIYTGLLLAALGTAIAQGEWRGLCAVVLACAALWRKLRLEERWMREQFGEAYDRYQAEVPALMPSLFRIRKEA